MQHVEHCVLVKADISVRRRWSFPLITLYICSHATAGEVPFSQNTSLIRPLDSCGGLPDPCLPLSCRHVKPVSRTEAPALPAIKILISYLLLSAADVQKYPHRCSSVTCLTGEWRRLYISAHTHTNICACTLRISLAVSLRHFSICKFDVFFFPPDEKMITSM